MIKVDVDQFYEDGYLILRNVINADELEALRTGVEIMVQREWPGGIRDGHFQPHMKGFRKHLGASTAHVMELLLHENTLGVARQIMRQAGFVCPAYIYMILNPTREMGPWFWHRDVNPITKGPLEGLIEDFKANGPAILQMNIAVYDDKVLWVVPGSHRRANTDAENAQLAAVPHGYAHGQQPQSEKRHTPLPNSVCADLQAGDAVIYKSSILHWGSDYTARVKRRCILLGYRCFDGPRFFYEGFNHDLGFTNYLSPQSRHIFERGRTLDRQETDTIEAIYRAVLGRDETNFRRSLADLHPGEPARFTCLIHLCKFAQRMADGKDQQYAPRFTTDEINHLWHRFTPLDEALKSDKEENLPGFQNPAPTYYRMYNLPPAFGIDAFVGSWNGT